MLYPQSTAYTIQALGYLATLAPGESIKARALAQVLGIPEPYLAKVLSQLVRKRFISSSKGPNGGFALAIDAKTVTLYRIMAATDSLRALEDECVMGLRACTSEAPCAFHDNWLKFKERVVEQAQVLTISDLSEIVTAKLRLKEK